MNEIWANRLIAGTQTWEKCVKAGRADAVKDVLSERVFAGKLTVDDYFRITGAEFEVTENG
ncbi:MAG: XkdX family protein [Oscillospiraceae bacterium]